MCGGVCSPFHKSSLIHTCHLSGSDSGLTGPLVCVYLASQTFLFVQVIVGTGGIAWRPHVAIGSPSWLMALCQSHYHLLGTGISGGPNVPLETVLWLMANSHSHSFGTWRLFSPWFSSSHDPWHLICSPIPHQQVQPVLHSYQALTWHQMDLAWFMCTWFASSHLPPPSHSLTLTTLTGLRQCFDTSSPHLA